MRKTLFRSLLAMSLVTVLCAGSLTACDGGEVDPFGTDMSLTTASTAAPAQTTAPPASDTTAPVTTQAPVTTEPITTQSSVTTEPPTLSEAEIMLNNIAAMSSAVNAAKNTKDFYGHKDQKVSFKLTSNVPRIDPFANAIISKLAHDNVKEYNFKNGISPNPKSGEPDVTPNEAIPPTDKDFTLDPAGLVSLTVTTEGNNTVYTAVIAEETVTLDNQVPYYHAMALDYIDVLGADLTGAKVNSATIVYHEATVIVTVDNTTGRLVSLREITPITSNGDVSVIGIPASGTIVGNLDESWTFRW